MGITFQIRLSFLGVGRLTKYTSAIRRIEQILIALELPSFANPANSAAFLLHFS